MFTYHIISSKQGFDQAENRGRATKETVLRVFDDFEWEEENKKMEEDKKKGVAVMNPSLGVEKEDKNTHLEISYIENGLFYIFYKFAYDDITNGIVKRKQFEGDTETNSKEKIKNAISSILKEDYKGLKDGLGLLESTGIAAWITKNFLRVIIYGAQIVIGIALIGSAINITNLDRIVKIGEISLESHVKAVFSFGNAPFWEGVYLDYEKNMYEDAITMYDLAIKRGGEKDKDIGTYYNDKGLALQNLKKYDEAKTVFEAGIIAAPKHSPLYNNLGTIYMDYLQDYETSLFYFNKAISISERPSYFYNKGKVLWILERYEEAIPSLDRAICLRPENQNAIRLRSEVLNNLKLNLTPNDYKKYINPSCT